VNFPAETRRKRTVFGRNPPENVRNSTQESGDRIRLSVLPGFCLFRTNPVTGSVSRNTASTFRRFPVFSCGIRPVLLDLGLNKSKTEYLRSALDLMRIAFSRPGPLEKKVHVANTKNIWSRISLASDRS
jgi:hypothetical protein